MNSTRRIFGATVAFLMGVNFSCASGGASPQKTDPEVVPAVDFNRYSGLWNDIAHSPNFFQRQCVRSTAEYKVISTDAVSVHNVCYKADGQTSDISGAARVTDPNVPAKLRVRFNFFARGDYWITHLDPNYEWAVVSGPAKESIFILAREFPMDPALLSAIVSQLKSEGYETDTLVYDRPL